MNLMLLAFWSFGVTGILGGLIALCVFVLVAILVLWLLQLLLGALGVTLPPNVWLIIKIIIALIGILYALRVFGVA